MCFRLRDAGRHEYGALEIGFLFNEAYWGEAYAAESCEALIREAFRGGVNRICAQCDPDNPASWRLLEKLGFAREGHLQRNVFFGLMKKAVRCGKTPTSMPSWIIKRLDKINLPTYTERI